MEYTVAPPFLKLLHDVQNASVEVNGNFAYHKLLLQLFLLEATNTFRIHTISTSVKWNVLYITLHTLLYACFTHMYVYFIYEGITRSIDRRRQRVSNVLPAHRRCSARLAWPQILRMQPPRGMQSSILRGNTPMTALHAASPRRRLYSCFIMTF